MSTIRIATIIPSSTVTVRTGTSTFLDTTVASSTNASVTLTGGLRLLQTTVGTGLTSPGALYSAGGVGIGGKLFVNDTAQFLNTTGVSSTTSASVIISGGLLVSQRIAIANTSGHYFEASNDANLVLLTLNNTTNGIIFNISNQVANTTQQSVARFWSLGTSDASTNQEYLETGFVSTGLGYMIRTVQSGTGVHRRIAMSATSGVTDQLVLLTDRSTTLSGNLTVQSTTASTTTSIGAIVCSGGMGVATNVRVGGSVFVNAVEIFPQSEDRLRQVSFSLANNTVTATNITGLLFSTSYGAKIIGRVRVIRSSGGDLTETYDMVLTRANSGWLMTYNAIGDSTTLVTFTITTGGQVQYTMGSIANFTSATFVYLVYTVV